MLRVRRQYQAYLSTFLAVCLAGALLLLFLQPSCTDLRLSSLPSLPSFPGSQRAVQLALDLVAAAQTAAPPAAEVAKQQQPQQNAVTPPSPSPSLSRPAALAACGDVPENRSAWQHQDSKTGSVVLQFNSLTPAIHCLLQQPDLGARAATVRIEDGPHLSECQRADYGQGLLDRWYAAQTEICTPKPGSAAPSRIVMHALRQARHSGDDYYLEVHNSTLEAGRLHVSCQPTNTLQQPHLFSQQQGLKQYIALLDYSPPRTPALAAALLGPSSSSAAAVPAAGAITTLFIDRDCLGPGNLYHCSADIINAFMLVQQLRLTPATTRLIFTDASPGLTKFGQLWTAMASHLHLSSELPALSLALPYSVAALQSGSNMVWKDFWLDDPCGQRAPILAAYAQWAASLFLPPQLYEGETAPLPATRPLVVMMPTRRGAKYRRASNEEALLQHLASLFPASSRFLLVELGTLSFAQQVLLINSVDVVVGMHGAALTLMLYTHPAVVRRRGLRLFELFTHEKDRPRVYANICTRLGIPYNSWVGNKEAQEIELDVHEIGSRMAAWYKWQQ